MPRRLWLISLTGGIIGGSLAAVAAIFVAGGGGDGSRTVIVEPSLTMPVGVSAKAQGMAREVYYRDAPGVVFVRAEGVNDGQSVSEFLKGESHGPGTATGSGFEVDGEGTILTNWHVVQDAVKVIVGLEHGHTVEARLVSVDASNDLAVLRIPTAGLTLHPLALGESSNVHVGDAVLAIGNPFALGGTLTTGVISALQRKIEAPNGATINNVLQTDAPINPGNSGGPLLNERGEVIGVNAQIVTSGGKGGNVGIAFAIPVDRAKAELSVIQNRSPTHE